MSVRRRSITSRLTRDLNREIGSHEFTRGMFEARGKALELADQQIGQLRGELSLAEEGLANYAQENERLKQYEPLRGGKPLKVVLLEQKLKEIRDHSLTWAMVCDCDCPACNGMYEAIRDAEPQSCKS